MNPKDLLKQMIDNQGDEINHRLVRIQIEGKEEWLKWMQEMPYLSFPSHWQVKIIPPFASALARFLVRTEKIPEDQRISVYFDGYQNLGYFGKPYWEVYPASDGDTARFAMNDTEGLLKEIEKAIKKYETRT